MTSRACSASFNEENSSGHLALRARGRTDYNELRDRFIASLEAATLAHESGELRRIDAGYDDLDRALPRYADPRYNKLHIALRFWDRIDTSNHDWHHYEPLSAADWPVLARQLVAE